MLNLLLLTAIATTPANVHASHGLGAPYCQVESASDGSAQSKEEKKHEQDVKNDVEAGKKYSAEVDKQYKASTNEEAIKRVQRIGAELAEIANRTRVNVDWGDKKLSKFDYTFKVVQGKDVNAFSLPGGIIYVYEGLVDYCETDDELAGVLAHEIAHAAFRHVATLQAEASKLQAIQIPLVLAGILLGGASTGVDVLQGTGLISQAYMSGWSVKAEKAADYGGLQYITQSRYDATGMVTIQERLARSEKGPQMIDWGIYQTHPPSRERVESLTAAMIHSKIPIRRSAVSTSFRTTVKPGKDCTELWFNGRKIYAFAGTDSAKRAEDAAVKLNSFFDGVPQMFQVTVSADQILGDKRVLFEVTKEDAALANLSLDSLVQATAKEIKGSIYMLAYRVWDAR